MSRSYKRNPIVKDDKRNKRRDKRMASKAARRKSLCNGCMYKKVYNSYNINDHRLGLWWLGDISDYFKGGIRFFYNK